MGNLRLRDYCIGVTLILQTVVASSTANSQSDEDLYDRLIERNEDCRGSSVLFFNGVGNTRLKTIQHTIALYEIYGTGEQEDYGAEVCYWFQYNTSGFLGIPDVIETFDQRFDEADDLLFERYELLLPALTGNSLWWDQITENIPIAEMSFDAIRQTSLDRTITELAALLANPPTEENYSAHRAFIDELLEQQYSLLFIAHSQGNLFANVAYDYSLTRTTQEYVKLVHVAPASIVLNGDYVLANLDLVISGLLQFTGSVPASTHAIPGIAFRPPGYNGNKDPWGHGFQEIYLNPSLQIAHDLNDYILAALAYLKTPALEELKPRIEQNLPGEITASHAAEGGFSYVLERYWLDGCSEIGGCTASFDKRINPLGESSNNTVIYSDGGLEDDSSYYYVSVATNEHSGLAYRSEPVTVTIQERTLLPPTNIVAVPANQQVKLSWTSDLGASSYNLYYAEQSFGNPPDVENYALYTGGTRITGITSTEHAIGGLTNDTIYYFVVTSAYADRESDPSSEVLSAPIPPSGKINDTGITWGANYPTGNNVTCIGETIEQQDCSNGRDATHNDDSDGHAGFSYTKLDSSGNLLPASAFSWSCVRDNVTGLVWEVKTSDGGLHDKSQTYPWVGMDPMFNPLFSILAGDLVDGSNSEQLCGYTDWRVPILNELVGIVDYSIWNPAIDINYFPNVLPQHYFSATPAFIWVFTVDFTNGEIDRVPESTPLPLRLVRGE